MIIAVMVCLDCDPEEIMQCDSRPIVGSGPFCGPAAQTSEEHVMDLHGRNLLKDIDLTREEFLYLVDLAGRLRQEKRLGQRHARLSGRNIALIFEKSSTRTRSAFEVAAYDEGAQVTYLGPGDAHLGRKESAKDTARVLGRIFDGIEYRGSSQEALELLGAHAGVPVWNGMTDAWHPTQTLADVLTICDHSGKPLSEVSICYLGDGSDGSSLLVSGALLGLDVRICSPETLPPRPDVLAMAQSIAAESGARLTVTADVAKGVTGADFVYTDIWLRTTAPPEVWDERVSQLFPYQVNSEVMKATGNPKVKFMHPLPSLHDTQTAIGYQVYERYGIQGVEVTDEVFESSASVVFDQSENRMHTIKAVMVATLLESA
jgi:ornithine carbamoyltransferase